MPLCEQCWDAVTEMVAWDVTDNPNGIRLVLMCHGASEVYQFDVEQFRLAGPKARFVPEVVFRVPDPKPGDVQVSTPFEGFDKQVAKVVLKANALDLATLPTPIHVPQCHACKTPIAEMVLDTGLPGAGWYVIFRCHGAEQRIHVAEKDVVDATYDAVVASFTKFAAFRAPRHTIEFGDIPQITWQSPELKKVLPPALVAMCTPVEVIKLLPKPVCEQCGLLVEEFEVHADEINAQTILRARCHGEGAQCAFTDELWKFATSPWLVLAHLRFFKDPPIPHVVPIVKKKPTLQDKKKWLLDIDKTWGK